MRRRHAQQPNRPITAIFAEETMLPADVPAPGDSFTLSIDYPDSLLKSSHKSDFIFHKPKADEGGFSVESADNVAVYQALTDSLRVVVS